MTTSRRTSIAFKSVFLTSALVLLGACSTLTLGEQRKNEAETLRGNQSSAYAILSCGELAVIDTSARQRLAGLTPTTVNRAEQELLLRAQISEMVENRETLGCPVPRSATLLPIDAETPTATPAPSAPVVTAAAQPATAQAVAPAAETKALSGRFLQIGTYGDPTNAQSAADYFADRGFRAVTRVSTAGGVTNHRVLVGPLSSDQDLSRASNAARSYGVNDAFVTDG